MIINNGFIVDKFFIYVLGFLLLAIVFVCCMLIGIVRINQKNIDTLFGRVQALQFSKQDDTSKQLTDEEWINLCKMYRLELPKPHNKITYNTAIVLLEYLNNNRTPS